MTFLTRALRAVNFMQLVIVNRPSPDQVQAELPEDVKDPGAVKKPTL